MQGKVKEKALSNVWEVEKALCDFYAVEPDKAGEAIKAIIEIKEILLNECKN